jgi:hypothetical protein
LVNKSVGKRCPDGQRGVISPIISKEYLSNEPDAVEAIESQQISDALPEKLGKCPEQSKEQRLGSPNILFEKDLQAEP